MAEEQEISLEATLRRLLAEIAVGDYRDGLGHPLTRNTAYIQAVAMLELVDLLGGERDSRERG